MRAEQSPQSSQCPDASHVFMMIHAQLLHQGNCPWPFSSLLPRNMICRDLLPDRAWIGVMSQGRQ